MAKLTITGNVLVKDGHVDFVKEELLKLISITESEKGCIKYDLHQDNENPNYFVFMKIGKAVSCGRPIWGMTT